jgi:23S rRNA (cytosine1962-C5)-methyltransferase
VKTLVLKPGKEKSVLRKHPWIFSGAINKFLGNEEPENGELVSVEDAKGNFLAVGHYQKATISVRIISFIKQKIDDAFWREKLNSAYALRKTANLVKNKHTNIYRLVHAEGDGLPGLIIDIYGNTAVMQCHSAGMYKVREQIAQQLVELAIVSNVYDKSAESLSKNTGITAENAYLIKNTPIETNFLENNLQFYIDWEAGQKTGFFIDQRNNRALLEKYSNNKNVLNTFCYTGGFSVYALRGGAKKVVSVDYSEKAIELTNKNVNLNKYTNHKAITTDAFAYLKEITENEFDLIILDPPAFAKHQKSKHNAIQGYKRLNKIALQKIQSGGILFTFSCSQVITPDIFYKTIYSAALETGRNIRILHKLGQPEDHPVNIYHPEGEYLKGLVLYVE